MEKKFKKKKSSKKEVKNMKKSGQWKFPKI